MGLPGSTLARLSLVLPAGLDHTPTMHAAQEWVEGGRDKAQHAASAMKEVRGQAWPGGLDGPCGPVGDDAGTPPHPPPPQSAKEHAESAFEATKRAAAGARRGGAPLPAGAGPLCPDPCLAASAATATAPAPLPRARLPADPPASVSVIPLVLYCPRRPADVTASAREAASHAGARAARGAAQSGAAGGVEYGARWWW